MENNVSKYPRCKSSMAGQHVQLPGKTLGMVNGKLPVNRKSRHHSSRAILSPTAGTLTRMESIRLSLLPFVYLIFICVPVCISVSIYISVCVCTLVCKEAGKGKQVVPLY